MPGVLDCRRAADQWTNLFVRGGCSFAPNVSREDGVPVTGQLARDVKHLRAETEGIVNQQHGQQGRCAGWCHEGICATELHAKQLHLLREIAADFLLLKPEQRDFTLAGFDATIADTWLSRYGATVRSQPFYSRIQSPVILAELDHHAGVWLNDRLPAKFHVHTTLRMPNGGDYGKALLAGLEG